MVHVAHLEGVFLFWESFPPNKLVQGSLEDDCRRCVRVCVCHRQIPAIPNWEGRLGSQAFICSFCKDKMFTDKVAINLLI